MAAIDSTDIVILTARAGCMRAGTARAGFYPNDVEGTTSDEPGEYVWKEVVPATTSWTLVT